MENPTVPPDHPNNSNRALAWIIGFLDPPHPNNSDRDRAIALGSEIDKVWSFTIIFIIILLLGFSSKHPEFRVDSFSLSNFTLVGNDSSSSAISMAAQVQLTAQNPNTYVSLSFGAADANVYYRSSRSLGPTVLPPFSLGKKSRAPLTASFAAVVETGGSNGNVAVFDLRLLSSVRYKERPVGRRRNHGLTVFCDGLVVGIPSDHGRPGGLIRGAPSPCGALITSS